MKTARHTPPDHLVRRRHAARAGRLALLALGLLAAATRAAEPPSALPEHQIQALYLYNLTRYVECAASNQPTAGTPYLIGIAGAPDVGRDLEGITCGKRVNGQEIRVVTVACKAETSGCGMVFIGDDKMLKAMDLGSPEPRPVLWVGATPGFLERGGMINLFRSNGTIRLEIDLELAQRRGFTISSKVLALATVRGHSTSVPPDK